VEGVCKDVRYVSIEELGGIDGMREWMTRQAIGFCAVMIFGCVGAAVGQTASDGVTLARVYVAGETVGYKMQGLNESPQRTFRYEAHAHGVVKREDSGVFVEDLGWRDLQANGAAFALSPESEAFREPLSLDLGYKLSVPDLSKVQPILIGPITDLLTFYADVQLAMRQHGLTHAGDHVYVKHGVPNSWADGRRTLLGQDSVDFDITLVSVDEERHVAKLVVKHVSPAQPQIKIPAEWMNEPVGSLKNNWVQIQTTQDRGFLGEIGQESFEADIELAMPSGRILSATLDNPVEVKERACEDAALTVCGKATRYRILRQISVTAEGSTR
jgi:hypothetical protein